MERQAALAVLDWIWASSLCVRVFPRGARAVIESVIKCGDDNSGRYSHSAEIGLGYFWFRIFQFALYNKKICDYLIFTLCVWTD